MWKRGMWWKKRSLSMRLIMVCVRRISNTVTAVLRLQAFLILPPLLTFPHFPTTSIKCLATFFKLLVEQISEVPGSCAKGLQKCLTGSCLALKPNDITTEKSLMKMSGFLTPHSLSYGSSYCHSTVSNRWNHAEEQFCFDGAKETFLTAMTAS